MAMKSLTWNYNTSFKLIGCGIDAERIGRFDSFASSDEYPMPFVFSWEEIKYFDQLSNPAKGFCSAFCCKEALYKGITKAYNYPECEFFLSGENPWQTLKLSDSLSQQFGIDSAKVRLYFLKYPSYTECLAAVYLFKNIYE